MYQEYSRSLGPFVKIVSSATHSVPHLEPTFQPLQVLGKVCVSVLVLCVDHNVSPSGTFSCSSQPCYHPRSDRRIRWVSGEGGIYLAAAVIQLIPQLHQSVSCDADGLVRSPSCRVTEVSRLCLVKCTLQCHDRYRIHDGGQKAVLLGSVDTYFDRELSGNSSVRHGCCFSYARDSSTSYELKVNQTLNSLT